MNVFQTIFDESVSARLPKDSSCGGFREQTGWAWVRHYPPHDKFFFRPAVVTFTCPSQLCARRGAALWRRERAWAARHRPKFGGRWVGLTSASGPVVGRCEAADECGAIRASFALATPKGDCPNI